MLYFLMLCLGTISLGETLGVRYCCGIVSMEDLEAIGMHDNCQSKDI